MNSRNEMFEKAPIPRAVATMAIPSMITMLVVVIYNMADTFFIGQTGDPVQVAAVSLAMPIFSVFMAIGSMFGMGGNSTVARALGSGRADRVKNISAFCFYTVIGLGIILAIFMFILLDPVMNICGVTDATYEYTKSYLTYITMGAPFIMLANCCGNLLRGEGAATASMIGNMTGTITNIILDPIFILVLGWGVGGAGAATVLGNILACVYYLCYFIFNKKTQLSIKPKFYKWGDKIASSVISIGLPTALNSLLMSIATVVMNNTMGKYGEDPLAAMNVAMRINMLVVFMQSGLCMGVMPLVGYNYGSGNKKRMMNILYFTGACAVAIGTVLTVIMVFARSSIVAAFINDENVVSYGIHYLVGIQTSAPFVGLFFLSTSTLQGMGKATYSLLMTLLRQFVAYIPAILLLDHFFGLNGLCYAQPIADYFSIIVGLIIVSYVIRKFKPDEKRPADTASSNPTQASAQ